jgi:integrase
MSEVRGIKKGAIHDDKLFIENVIVTIGGRDIEKSLAKTDSTRRVVKLPPQLKEMILAQDGEYATTLSRKAIYSRFKRLMEKSGYDNVRFHDLRHIAASDMNRLGITDRVAADRGGWSTTTTMRNVYQHSFEADRVSADEKVSDYYEELLKKFSDDTK